MKPGDVTFRCASMSEPGVFHHIVVPREGWVECSCNGVNWCSHIDATLVVGERHMVPSEDWKKANIAAVFARGRLKAPDGWQATWRSNRRWRGLPTVRSRAALKALTIGRPLIAISGRGVERQAMEQASLRDGWEVTREVVEGCAFLIVPDVAAETGHKAIAERRGVPVLGYEDWASVSAEMARLLTEAMRQNTD